MFKLWTTIKKDLRILSRDRVGLLMMFAMPILLVVVITSVQNSTFDLVNNNKLWLLVCNQDRAPHSEEVIAGLHQSGMFHLIVDDHCGDLAEVARQMKAKNAFVAVIIPTHFSQYVDTRAGQVAFHALSGLGLDLDTSGHQEQTKVDSITLLYHPVLQASFRQSLQGAIRSVIDLVQNKQIVGRLYGMLHSSAIPDSLEREILANQVPITQLPVSRGGNRDTPNATEHNVPAWTIFAMFFVVVSMGSSLVREKLNGSFVRLKSLPTSFSVALFSKQLTYLMVTISQAAVIFAIGILLFPVIGLPKLNLPGEWWSLGLVTLVCGMCATSFALCVGALAESQEQANGFGSAAVIILAAIGGLLVPSFAMPASFGTVMKLSPLHWCLESYYGLFLEGSKLSDIMVNIISLLIITLVLQAIALATLRRKSLI